MLLKIETKACKINPLNAKLANSPSPSPLLVNCPLYIGFSCFFVFPPAERGSAHYELIIISLFRHWYKTNSFDL